MFFHRSAPVLERPLEVEPLPHAAEVVADAIKLIEIHTDKEARNRRMTSLAPRDLCPMQKAELVQDLAHLLR